MENLARREYDKVVDDKVKEELLIANVPILKVGVRNNSEVKTNYIGILNGFVFSRAWTYWVVSGYMPLEYADCIYEKNADLCIRAGGHCGNVKPDQVKTSKKYEEDLKSIFKKYANNIKGYFEEGKKLDINDYNDYFVDFYHIDTQLGLNKLAEFIKQNDIYTDFIN